MLKLGIIQTPCLQKEKTKEKVILLICMTIVVLGWNLTLAWGCANFTKIWESSHNSKHKKSDMKVVP